MQRIAAENAVFYTERGYTQICDSIERLNALIENKVLDEGNRTDARALVLRLKVKRILIFLIDRNLGISDLSALVKELELILTEATDAGFGKTAELAGKARDFTVSVTELYAELAAARRAYLSPDGKYAPINESSCLDAITAYQAARERTAPLPVAAQIFPYDGIVFMDIHAELNELIDSLISEAQDVQNDFTRSLYLENVNKGLITVPEEWSAYPWKPAISPESMGETITVVCTPFEKEFLFLAYSVAAKLGKRAVYVNLDNFGDYTQGQLDRAVETLGSHGSFLAINGLSSYRSDNKQELIKALYKYIKCHPGTQALLRDHTGTRNLWVETESTLGAVADITYQYHSVPDYNDTLELFKSEGLVKTSDDESFLKTYCPYMGFIGLNETLRIFAISGQWRETAYGISRENAGFATGYFKGLPSQSQLLDEGWGEHSPFPPQYRGVRKAFDFDYDEKRLCNPKNVEKIAKFPELTLAERCGLMVRYCLTLGENSTSWAEMEKQDKIDRVTLATKSVGRLLNCKFDPVVEVPDEIEGKAGGYCSGGGRKIVYQYCSLGDYEWLSQAICHEMFHSFQFTAMNDGWKLWHATELNVSKYRVNEWRNNEKKYYDINKNYHAYYLQVMEADARVFEKETFEGANEKWQLLDLD